MNEFFVHERRQHPRYEAEIPVVFASMHVPSGMIARTHDIASAGLGLTLQGSIRPGVWVDMALDAGHGRPAVPVRGRVVWSVTLDKGRSRAGIVLAGNDLQPIALVLGSIRTRTRYDLG